MTPETASRRPRFTTADKVILTTFGVAFVLTYLPLGDGAGPWRATGDVLFTVAGLMCWAVILRGLGRQVKNRDWGAFTASLVYWLLLVVPTALIFTSGWHWFWEGGRLGGSARRPRCRLGRGRVRESRS